MNLILKGYWSNNPIPVNEVIENPEIVLRVPISTVTLSADVDKAYVDEQDRLLGNEFTTALQALDDKKANAAAVTQALSTRADLIDGKVPASQLPEHVSDITEYQDSSFFPAVGESGRLYVDITTNISYRWGGTIYVPTGDGSVVLGTTAETAHRGDHGVIAYNHALSQGNPHNTTTSEITEGTNKYFTDLRVRNTVLSGLVKTNLSNVTNTDTVEVAVGKLAAKSEAGSTVNWVDISTLPNYWKNLNVSAANTKIEVARIDGMLWLRGYITTTNSISADTEILSYASDSYRWDNTFYTTLDYTLLLAKTSMYELGVGYSLNITQAWTGSGSHVVKIKAGQSYPTLGIAKALIQPVCIGVAKNP